MDDEISTTLETTSELYDEHPIDIPAIIISSDSRDENVTETSSLDGDICESLEVSPKSGDQNEGDGITMTTDSVVNIIGDTGATTMPDSMDYLSALPRSLKMMNVCSENHRHSVHLQKTLQKIAADRKKAWASIDHSQRNFIVQQVFDKHLQPFHTHRLETVESTVNHTTETNQDNVKTRRQPFEEIKDAAQLQNEDSDCSSMADSCKSSSTVRQAFSPRHQMAVDQEQRETMTANKTKPSDAHELNTNANIPRSVRTDWGKNDAASHTKLRTQVNSLGFQQIEHDMKKGKSSKNGPAVSPIKIRHAKNSLALSVAHFERTSKDEQHNNKLHTSTTRQSRQQPMVPGVLYTARQAPQKRRDITELKKVSDSSVMFPTLSKLLAEPKQIDDERSGPDVRLPPIIDNFAPSSAADPQTDQYNDLIDVLATSVCSHLSKLKLLRGNDQAKSQASRRKMYMYRRELLQRTRRQLLLLDSRPLKTT